MNQSLESGENMPRYDVDELIAVSARWMVRRAAFTEFELYDHLALNEFMTTTEVSDRDNSDLFEALQDAVVIYQASRGEPYLWVETPEEIKLTETQIGLPTYTFAQVVTSHAEIDEIKPIHEIYKQPEGTDGLSRKPESSIPREVEFVIEYLQQTVELVALTKTVRDELANRFGVTEEEASRMVQSAVSAGLVNKRNIGGRSGLTIATTEQSTKLPTKTIENSIDVKYEEELDNIDRYISVVKYVMQSLTSLRDISMGQPYDKLWKRSNLDESMTFDEFKSFVRRMETDGLVNILRDAKLSTKTARSKVLRGSKVVLHSSEVRANWKLNHRQNLANLQETELQKIFDTIES